MDDTSKSREIAKYWDQHVGQHLNSFASWEANIPVMQHQNWRISGNRELNPLDWFWKKYGPFDQAASIGSGTGILEQHVCSMPGFGGTIVGHDISPRSIEIAKQNCAGFHAARFVVADLNTYQWPGEGFDVVFAHGALHHVESLDWCVGQMRQALQPGELLYVNDYVGPPRFQWSDVQMRLANELLKTVPERWVKTSSVSRCDAEKLKKDDPSEAVCTHFIEDALSAHFHIVERKLRGGTLLAPIFGSACLNISILESADGLQCLADMARMEGKLIDAGILRSDYVVVVAKRRADDELPSRLRNA